MVTSGEVAADGYGGRATFRSLKKTDQGRYICSAINDVGSDDGYVELRVLGKQTPVTPVRLVKYSIRRFV